MLLNLNNLTSQKIYVRRDLFLNQSREEQSGVKLKAVNQIVIQYFANDDALDTFDIFFFIS